MLGGFGLITGQGEARYADIRLLARDSFDPAAAIERELALARIAADPALRQPGTFAGVAPPPLSAATWLQGEPTTLAAQHGHPVMLVFWSPAQDKVIKTADYYAHLAKAHAGELGVIVMCDSGTREPEARSYLAEHPIPGARIAIDQGSETFESYYVKPGHHGMPRIILIDAGGIVQFEGDPGLRSGSGWQPGVRTYLDDPLERLLAGDR